MKYDAGMTGFHKDIVAAIKSMIHGDSDKVAELAAEGSPVPLKDYLREHHGKTFHGGNKFDCMSSAFLVKFDTVIPSFSYPGRRFQRLSENILRRSSPRTSLPMMISRPTKIPLNSFAIPLTRARSSVRSGTRARL